jgi:glycosyltransferase involved in cell wall biosynthesis
MDVSIVIPTYNNKEKLQMVLKYLLNQDYPKQQYEIIIADDGSSDGTKEVIKQYQQKHKSIKYISQKNKGFRAGQARNLGASISKGKDLVFLNDDIIAHPKLLKHYEKALQKFNVVLGYTSGYYAINQHAMNDFRNKNINSIPILKEFRHKLYFDEKKSISMNNRNLWQNFVATNYGIKKEVFL